MNGNAMHPEFMGFVTDEDSQMTVRAWAERQGFPATSVLSGGPSLFSQMLEASTPPKLVLVDIDGQSEPAASVARLAALCADCKIIAIGSTNDVSLYRNILSAGAIDYLVKPLMSEPLKNALNNAMQGKTPGKKEAREAKLAVVIGSRGGVGASTVAVNLGWLLAHDFKFKTALLDLDLQYGTSALSLDLEPGRGLRDIVSSPQRVDSLMISSSMVSESERFSVLGAEEAVDDYVPVDGGAITALMKEMTPQFDYIVVDLPRGMLATQKRLLSIAQHVVLVTELSLAGIRDTLRIKTALVALGCTGSITVVASRTGASQKGQVDAGAFEKGAQIKIDLTLPEDQKSVTAAANGGKALGEVAPHAPVTKALLVLAGKIAGKAKQAKTGGNFAAFLAGLKKKPDKKAVS